MHFFLTRSSAFKGKDLAKALQQAFHDCETEFIQIAGREGLRDGTTAVVALVQDEALTVAHVGDSRGVLCRSEGTAVAITQDHKPENDAEKKRIEALGGFVSHIGCWRAMGILAMSRAIGDLFLKPYVSAEPDVSTLSLEATDEVAPGSHPLTLRRHPMEPTRCRRQEVTFSTALWRVCWHAPGERRSC